MTTKKSPAMFYIRTMKPNDRGFHRIGCVIMKKANATHISVGWSLCNKADKFSARVAVAKATRRLAEAPTVIKINRDREGVYFQDMMDDLKLTTKLIKNYGNMTAPHRGIYTKNMYAATGAYQDLFPYTQSKSKV
jgi:hypothetical protein